MTYHIPLQPCESLSVDWVKTGPNPQCSWDHLNANKVSTIPGEPLEGSGGNFSIGVPGKKMAGQIVAFTHSDCLVGMTPGF